MQWLVSLPDAEEIWSSWACVAISRPHLSLKFHPHSSLSNLRWFGTAHALFFG